MSCSHTRLLKTCLVVFSPDQKMGSFRLIPAAFPWDPKALDPVLIQFSCSVWGSGSFRGLGVQTAIGAPCSSPWFWCHQCNLWDAGDSTLNPSLPIPHHWATPRAAGLDVIFANRNALVGHLSLFERAPAAYVSGANFLSWNLIGLQRKPIYSVSFLHRIFLLSSPHTIILDISD